MTNEEAKKMLKAKLECTNRFSTGCDLYCTRNDCDKCKCESPNNEKWEAISVLSEIRSEYNCFNEKERPYYHALSLAIKSLRNKQIEIEESEKDEANR